MAKNLKSDNFTYEIVKDIGAKGAFDKPLQAHPEVTVFLHTASPFFFNVKDVEKELLLPAIEGTKNALSAIAAHGSQIKRVVVTSSYAAILDVKNLTKPTVFTEKSWNPITWEESKANGLLAYIGSKTFAEKAAWDFVKAEKPKFVLSTVNPVYVFGPQAFDSNVAGTLNTSAEIINSILKLKPDQELPTTTGGFIDVRDVARAHLAAFENPKAEEQRLILYEAHFSIQEILDIINKNFSQFKGKIPVGKPGTGADQYKDLATIDNSETRKIIGGKFIDLQKTVYDTVKQIVDANPKL